MLRSILVPSDHSPAGDRGLAVAAALAQRAELPLRLVQVCQPAADPIAAEFELRRRARTAFPASCTSTVVQDDEIEPALARTIDARPDCLVVMGTRARHAVGEFLLGSVAEGLLVRGTHPLVLVGPHVDVSRCPSPQNLVVAVDDRGAAAALVDPVAEWARCFGGRLQVVQVHDPGRGDHGRGSAFVQRTAAALSAAGAQAEWEVLHGPDRVDALIDFTDGLGGGFIAVATRRWSDLDRIHWSSTARRLVHRSPHPVLVLPLHDD